MTVRVMVTGHRPKDLPGRYDYSHENYKSIRRLLVATLKDILDDYESAIFISGMAQGIDTVYVSAAQIIKDRSSKPIEIHGYIPHEGQAESWPKNGGAQSLWKHIRANILDKEFISSDVYHGGVMQMRNQDMVNNSDICIAVWSGKENGGTYDAVKRALKSGLRVIRLDPFTLQVTELSKG